MVKEFFPEEAFKVYFPTPEATPFEVDKFPKVPDTCCTYAGELANYVTGNPQGDISTNATPASYSEAASSNKHTRQGTIKQAVPPTANTAAALPSAAMQAIKAAQDRLNKLQTANQTNESNIKQVNFTLTTPSGKLEGNEAAILQLANTKNQQSHLLTQLSSRQDTLEKNITTLSNHFSLPVEKKFLHHPHLLQS